ncbi:TPA: response regulator transcription factor [Candidatus Avacholeplasma faecigallinarum]|nr:response regulator transcription factor [Candidatus Avacholeplasma faecigallinarum]
MDFLIYSIEDDKDIALIINKTLSKQGYDIRTFYDAKSFFQAFEQTKPNMILLDMMLPDMSGQEILKKIRANSLYDDIEIIIISANHMIMDKVDGFDLGADDYIEKPFDLLELMSRVQAKARRHKKNKITIGNFTIDFEKRACTINDEEIQLTTKEYEILALLCKNRGKVISRDDIFEQIWNTDQILESRTVDMHIKSIRAKLKENKDLIKTIYSVGYKINL